ncbi:MAG: ATP-dependent DNA helicase DinG [Carboxydocellales bacterium]
MGIRYLVVDVETTGTDPSRDEIIEIGAVMIQAEQIVHSWQTLIRPEKPIPLRISQLTGITAEIMQNAPSLAEILPDLRELLLASPVILVGHNVNFDISFLEAALHKQLINERLDTVELSRWALPLAKNHRLKTLTNLVKIEHSVQHRAFDDAKATAELFLFLIKQLQELPLDFLQQVIEIGQNQNGYYHTFWVQLLQNKIRLFPEGKINHLEGEVHNSLKVNLFTSPIEEVKATPVEFDPEAIKSLFEPEGCLAKNILGYENRIQQVMMVEAVTSALLGDKFLLMEAGTGTGKSLAYLVPVLYWAASNQQKVVVATHTINLQEQLWEKDIPLLKDIMPFELKAALLKGRNNYICLRRWNSFFARRKEYSLLESSFALRVSSWLRVTPTGDKAELNLYGKDNEGWIQVEAERDSCLGPQCSMFQKDCFLMKAKRNAEGAQLLIANHSLVFSDIKTENKVLPAYNYLVLDEAHQIEDAATEHLGLNLSQRTIGRFLNGLSRPQGEGTSTGMLGGLKLRQGKFQARLGSKDFLNFEQHLDQAIKLIHSVREESKLLFDLVEQFMELINGQGRNASGYRKVVRLREEYRELACWPALETCQHNVCVRLITIGEYLGQMAAILDRYQNVNETELLEDIKVLTGQAQSALDTGKAIQFILNGNDQNYVCWLEKDEHQEWINIVLKAAPIQVGPLLQEKLFNEKKAVIMTSATLTVEGDFSHFIERVGLNLTDPGRLLCKQVDSPFAFEEQALLCICRDLPSPSEVADAEYGELIAPLIRDLALVTQGKTLVLFTSHKMLKDVYWRVRPQLEEQGICVLGHGIDGSRVRLVEEFRESPKAVLFGANSFWEGVDLPGDVLRSVVIVKIPFVPPTLPTVEARLENLRNAKKNSFQQLSLPQAVLRLKQGFGRLIRTQQDFGVVVILDNRLLGKRYGAKFLRSLPVKNHFRGEKDLLVLKVADWLGR